MQNKLNLMTQRQYSIVKRVVKTLYIQITGMALVYTKLNIEKNLQTTVKKDKLKSHSHLCQSCCLSWQTMANMFVYIYLKAKSVTWR